jgi:hypothetical protein
MKAENEDSIVEAINRAKEIDDPVAAEEEKPRLLVEKFNPDTTVSALRDVLSDRGGLYDRGVPVRLVFHQMEKGMVAQVMKPDLLVLRAHQVCRPYALKETKNGLIEVNTALPRQFAVMYLDWQGEWRLRPLNGIASAPLLHNDGAISCNEGYDQKSGMWCENVPDLHGLIPERPTKEDAIAALDIIRETFKTFCFADAITIDDRSGVAVVDTSTDYR